MVLPLAALAIASAGLGALGKVLGGVGANTAAKSKAKALEASAAMARDEAGVNAQLALSEAERALGRAATVGAASGGGLTGSALNVLDDLSMQGVFNARRAVYEGETEARNRLMEAAVTRQQGKVQLVSGLIGGASSLLGGFASAAQAKAGG